MTMRFSIAVLALSLAAALPAAAQVTQTVRTTADLNVRSGPGTQHTVLGQFPRGTAIQVFDCTNPVSWCQTPFGNKQAWVSANHLDPRPTVVAQAPLPPAPPPSGAVPPADIPLFGPGFRTPEDLCRRAGESDFTNPFLGGGADLVACPPGTDPGLFAFETGGREVARRDGWILFTVPRS